MDREELGLSNGRLGSEIGDIHGDSTPDLASLIGKIPFISRRIALFRAREWENG